MTTCDDRLVEYVRDLFAVQDEALERARRGIRDKGLPTISVRPEEGRFLQFLVAACDAKKAVEIGALGGYSAIWIARGLAPGGKLISLEKEPKHATVAREHVAAADLADRVEIQVGDAHQLLQDLVAEGPFDFVFIDAEKVGYEAYLDWAVENLREGGVVAAHNAFRGGRVIDPQESDKGTRAMRALNRRVAQDSRLISTIFPAGDGTLVAVKRA